MGTEKSKKKIKVKLNHNFKDPGEYTTTKLCEVRENAELIY